MAYWDLLKFCDSGLVPNWKPEEQILGQVQEEEEEDIEVDGESGGEASNDTRI